MSNSLDPDQASCFVGLDLGPNCKQSLSENISRKSYGKAALFAGFESIFMLKYCVLRFI